MSILNYSKMVGGLLALGLAVPMLGASLPAQAQYYSNSSTWTTVRGTTDIKNGTVIRLPVCRNC